MRTDIVSFVNRLILLVIRCCVVNLSCAQACQRYAFGGMLLLTFFIQRL